MRGRKPTPDPNPPGPTTTAPPPPPPATVTDTDSCGDTASCTTCDESPSNNSASSNIHPSSGRTPPRPRQRVPSHHVLRRGAVTRLTDRAAGGSTSCGPARYIGGERQTAPASPRGRHSLRPSLSSAP